MKGRSFIRRPGAVSRPGLDRDGHIPRKSLGQNFLIDQSVLARIVSSCHLSREDFVVEIGPGKGALTRVLLPSVGRIVAVEADAELARKLRDEMPIERLTVIHEDFLRYDLALLPGPVKVIGNLPYNISTPIIMKILSSRRQVSVFYMTVQLEFGKRLTARPRTGDYSSLTCYVNYFAQPQILFEIRNTAFHPVPRVRSCFMRLDIRPEPAVYVDDEPYFLEMIRLAFLQRRKMLINSLLCLVPKADLTKAFEQAGIPMRSRAEELTLTQFAALANGLTGQDKSSNRKNLQVRNKSD